ncbi:MAG: hypothetical protein QGI15_04085 [Candidatus Scalindua sp.]|jgi:hypothetical protein|nr:hypothetical protein [Candidatus Scalindua sp.]|tara:strand:+ start:37 stop:792 length:756 start_codon:yes stop_codon:yes gene_type:complete
MLKRTISFAVALVLSAGLYAQDNPNIVSVVYFKPKAGQREQYLAGLKDHTDKFHSKGVARVRTYEVISGPKSGWYVRISQPLTWTDVDKLQAEIRSKAHAANAAKVVAPYIAERIGPMYWTNLTDLAYNPDTSGKPSKMIRINFTHVNPLMDGDYIELRRQLKEAHEKTDSDDSFTVHQLVHGGKMHSYAQVYRLNGWGDMGSSGPQGNVGSRVNEVFGERAWGQFMSKGRKIIYKRNDEMRIYMKDYSTR